MIYDIFQILFFLLAALTFAYLVRHYIFTLSVLRVAKTKKAQVTSTQIFEPTVTILIPACNEEKVIGRLLERTTEFTYQRNKLQVIVINDASTDATGSIIDSYSTKYSFIKALHRNNSNGGKGKTYAMNDGFRMATGEILLCFDADYYPPKDIVEKLVCDFADPQVGAVQGRVVVLNEPQNIITRLVTLERIGGYRVDQEARGLLGLIPQFGGTVGGFRKVVIENLKGWDESVLAEDTDLTFRIYLSGLDIRYKVDAECYEEAVDNWKAYRQQRYRWAKGHMQCYFKHLLNVLKSKNLNLRKKIDGFLLLNIYFMPILALLSMLIGIPLILLGSGIVSFLWFSICISLYSLVGNFAPFFEVGIGLYLDGRTRTQWLVPLLIFTFFYNIPICSKAFLDLVLSKIIHKNASIWDKTKHSGNGNHYIRNMGGN
jgi:cellulose synthase/poly-beta-1,6-N-acetylglucosamine synthase-like glycosyltransferase